MRTNGFLSYVTQNGGDVLNSLGVPDENGAVEWSEPVACSIQPNSQNVGVYENGKFDNISYTILVESIPLDAKRVRLEREGVSLGEHIILGKPIKTTMHRIKLYV